MLCSNLRAAVIQEADNLVVLCSLLVSHSQECRFVLNLNRFLGRDGCGDGVREGLVGEYEGGEAVTCAPVQDYHP